MDTTETVKAYYDANAQAEWERLERHPFEFELNRRFMDRYIKPGDRVLDIGGGPGRYALYYAERGCEVTLVDLSDGNIELARQLAAARGLTLDARVRDVLELDALLLGQYDHVLLMGPLYHLLEETERISAVNAALRRLAPGGMLYASFIAIGAALLYEARECPEQLLNDATETDLLERFVRDESYAGPAFTQAHFVQPREVLPFMARFPLEKLHFFGSECMLAPYEKQLAALSAADMRVWYDFAERICEKESLLATTEHLLYIGRSRIQAAK